MRITTVLLSIILAVPTLGLSLDKRQAAPCVLQCIGAATGGTSCAPSDTQCLCTNQLFIRSIAQCLPTLCNAADAMSGIAFGQAYCASVGTPVVIPNAAVAASPAAGTAAPAAAASNAAVSPAAVGASTPAAGAAASTAVAAAPAATTTARSSASSTTVSAALVVVFGFVACVV